MGHLLPGVYRIFYLVTHWWSSLQQGLSSTWSLQNSHLVTHWWSNLLKLQGSSSTWSLRNILPGDPLMVQPTAWVIFYLESRTDGQHQLLQNQVINYSLEIFNVFKMITLNKQFFLIIFLLRCFFVHSNLSQFCHFLVILICYFLP